MRARKPLTCRRIRSAKPWAVVTALAMLLSGIGSPILTPTVQAQVTSTTSGQGFTLDAGDLRFIYQQILVAQDHAAGGTLLGNGPNQVSDPQLPRGLRTVDGSHQQPRRLARPAHVRPGGSPLPASDRHAGSAAAGQVQGDFPRG